MALPSCQASYPGVISIESVAYTNSHGISPGIARLVVQPQPNSPDPTGDLTISDGNTDIVVPDCKIDNILTDMDERGMVHSLQIVDRRWRWREFGKIDMHYNFYDQFGKLRPWSIQSPFDMIEMCLLALGEVNYIILPPPGLANPGPDVTTPIINISGVNPEINIIATPPAQVLQQLCDLFGLRVVYVLSGDYILITPPNQGADLPTDNSVSIYKISPSLKLQDIPDGVGVVGRPTRYQARWRLEAVGEDWDGHIYPIDDLSYAPRIAGVHKSVSFTISYDNVTGGVNYQIFLGFTTDQDPTQGFLASYTANPGTLVSTIAANLETAINISADPRIRGVVRATSSGNVVTVTGVGWADFSYLGRLSQPNLPAGNGITTALLAAARDPTVNWRQCQPPQFEELRATPRLTRQQAIALAQKSVFKYYRIVNVNVDGTGAPMVIPGYDGVIERIQQILLQDTMVDQIVPAPGDQNLRDVDDEPLNRNFYNGLSRDKPAACYGSIAIECFDHSAAIFYSGDEEDVTNTDFWIPIPFRVVPEWQMLVFSDHVYTLDDDDGTIEPHLVLQTACTVLDAETNVEARFEQYIAFSGQFAGQQAAIPTLYPKVVVYPDIQLNVSSTYRITDQDNNYNRLTSTTVLEADPFLRASYYLRGLMAQYRQLTALVVEYNGLQEIDCDGAIMQVTYTMEAGGFTTTASRNAEHNIYVPPYPQRRRQEYIAADMLQNVSNRNDLIAAAVLAGLAVGR